MKDRNYWQFKQATEEKLELYLYGYIQDDYYDYWSGETVESETSANHFKNELAKYPSVKEIVMYVNSNGGDVMQAMAIRNQLKRHPAKKTAYVDGFACSAASFILTGCDKVVMYSNTMQMLHHMWTYAVGNFRELRKASEDLEQISIGNRKAYTEKSNGKLTEEQVEEILANETWLTAQQCLEYGLADEIVSEEKDLTEAKALAKKVNQNLEQQISYNKALVATLRAAKEPAEPETKKEPLPDKPAQNKPMKLLKALMGGKGE